jgi:hypothetical protein
MVVIAAVACLARRFRDDGDLIDCTKMGVGGKVIPSLIDRVSDIEVITEVNVHTYGG